MADASTLQMQEITRYPHGVFSWGDLLTTDLEDAKRFYGSLFGWTFIDNPVNQGILYTFASNYDKPVAGMMGIPGVAPTWQAYVTVDNADAVAAQVMAAGGTVLDGPVDVNDNGRMIVLRDPAGNTVGGWQPYNFIGAAFAQGPGVPIWRELWTEGDIEDALAFYRQVFGWSGQMQQEGDVAYGACNNGETLATVILPNSAHPGEPHPGWVVYFGSADVPGDAAKVEALGGSVTYGPTEMGGYPFAACRDPQGAVFMLMGTPAR